MHFHYIVTLCCLKYGADFPLQNRQATSKTPGGAEDWPEKKGKLECKACSERVRSKEQPQDTQYLISVNWEQCTGTSAVWQN